MAITNRQRLDLLAAFLRERKYADLGTLARHFDASLSTIRRDLNELEAKGMVRRHHGGASAVDNEEEEPSGGYDFIIQDNRALAAKHSIAEHLVEKIHAGMTVMLDGGTTTYAVARLLVGKRIIVITNSLPIAALFNEVSTSETIVTGGTVYNRLGVLYGPTCEASLAEMHADIAILGAAGITSEGVWNTNAMIVSYQKQMMRAADHTYFALDQSKFGKRALFLSTPFHDHMTVVGTGRPDQALLRALRNAGAQFEEVTSPQWIDDQET